MLFECAVMKIKLKVPFSFTYYLLVNSRISLQLLDGGVFLHITKDKGKGTEDGRVRLEVGKLSACSCLNG